MQDEFARLLELFQERFLTAGDELTASLEEGVELDDGTYHLLESMEELRLTLNSFLRKDLLDSLLLLFKVLNQEPPYTEMFSWFVRNSQYGGECRYALGALEAFREERLERCISLMKECIEIWERDERLIVLPGQ